MRSPVRSLSLIAALAVGGAFVPTVADSAVVDSAVAGRPMAGSAVSAPVALAARGDVPPPGYESMSYVRMGNTGVQGDTSEALWVGPDGNPWIGGYDPTFEEGGLAKYRVKQDRFVQVSNVDRRVLFSPSLTFSSRVLDIVGAPDGRVWFATRLGVFAMRDQGQRPIARVVVRGETGSGGADDLDVSPDGVVWAADRFLGRVARIDPANGRVTTRTMNVANIAVQRLGGGDYYVWAGNAHEPGAPLHRYDSRTRRWTTVDTSGAHVYWLGSDPADDQGRMYAVRAVGPDDQGITTYSFGWFSRSLVWHDLPLWDDTAGAEFLQRLRAYGDGDLLVAYGDGNVWRHTATGWQDLGIGGPNNGGLGIQGLDLNERTGVVWTSGPGGANYRDAGGLWHRLRITNSSMGDNFPLDLDVAGRRVYVTQNVSTDVGGWGVWDGKRWKNNTQLGYGLKGTVRFPYNTSGTNAILHRRGGAIAVALTGGGVVQYGANGYTDLDLPNWEPTSLAEDGAGRLWAADNSMLIGYREAGVWHNFFEDGAPVFATAPAADPDHPRRVWATGIDGTVWTDGVDHRWLRLPGRWVVPIGHQRAWVGADDGLYRVDMRTGTWRRFPARLVGGAETGPLALTPDGLLWYTCDADLCWLDTTTLGRARPRTGVFHVRIEPQWGSLPWHPTDADVLVRRAGYELWLTTPSRGLTVLKVHTG